MGQQAEKDKTKRVTGLGRRTKEEIAKWNQMTALRFQTGGRHQTSPASLRGLIEQDSSDYSSFRLEIFRHQQQVIHFSSKSKPSSINLITHIHFSSNSNHAPHTQITTYRNYGVPKKCCYFFSSCYLNYVKILINIP